MKYGYIDINLSSSIWNCSWYNFKINQVRTKNNVNICLKPREEIEKC